MELSDEQLLEVFEQLDDNSDGFVSLESLFSFAESAGHDVLFIVSDLMGSIIEPSLAQDINFLRTLDVEGSGQLDFVAFAKGVKRMTGKVSR